MEIGEIVYCESQNRFFSITNIGKDWVFGEWNDAKQVIGRVLPKSMFRRTSYLELFLRTRDAR